MYMNSQPYPYAMPQNNAIFTPAYQQAMSASPQYQIREDDKIILLSLDEYLAHQGYTPKNVRPDEWIRIIESAGDIFYSDIAQRLTRVIPWINYAPEEDDRRIGLQHSIEHHMRNPRFVAILMKELYQENNQEANAFIGAFFVTAAESYVSEMKKLDEADAASTIEKTKKEKDGKETKVPEPPKKSHRDDNIVASMYGAAMRLLSDKYEYVKNTVLGIDTGNALAIAAYLAMNNQYGVKCLLKSNLPLTSDLLENDPKIHVNPGRVIDGLLKLKKADYVKLTVNQQKFLDTLIKWVYVRLDTLQPSACLEYLRGVYQTSAPADLVKGNLIQLKDCGPQYAQLSQVTKALNLN